MTKEEILAAAGFPNTPEGIAAFYDTYGSREEWEQAQQQMAYGGMPNIMGIPFGAGITMRDGGLTKYQGNVTGSQVPGFDSTNMVLTGQGDLSAQQAAAAKLTLESNNEYTNTAGDRRFVKNINPGVSTFSANGTQGDYMNTPTTGTVGINYNTVPTNNNFTALPILGRKPNQMYDTNTGKLISQKKGGTPCYDCGGPHMQGGGAMTQDLEGQYPVFGYGGYDYDYGGPSPFNYGQFPAMKPGGDPDMAALWLAQQQFALQKRTGKNFPSDAKPTGTNPLNFNPYLKGSDIAEIDSMHTNPYDPRIAAYFKGSKVIAGPAENTGPAIQAARNINRGKMFKKDDEIYTNYRKTGGNSTAQGGNQDFLTQYRDDFKNVIRKNVDTFDRKAEFEAVQNAFMKATTPQQQSMGYQTGGGMMSYRQDYNQIDPMNAANQAMYQDQIDNFQNERSNVYSGWKDLFTPQYADEGIQTGDMSAKAGETYSQWAKRNNIPGGGKTLNDRVWDGRQWSTVKQPQTNSQNYGTSGSLHLPNWEYQNHLPNNTIRTGYTLGKKDFARMNDMGPNAQITGAKFNYGPVGRLMPNRIGPRSIEVGVTGPGAGRYEDQMHAAEKMALPWLQNNKKGKKSDYQGPFPETELPSNTADYTGVNDQNAFGELFPQGVYKPGMSPQDMMSSNLYKTPNMGPSIDTRWEDIVRDPINPYTNMAKVPRNNYGGLYKAFDGFENSVKMEPDYLAPKNSFELFDAYANQGLKDSIQDTEDLGLRNPDTNSPYGINKFKFKKQTKGVGMTALKNAPLIADTLRSGINAGAYRDARENLDASQISMNAIESQRLNAGSRGDYATYLQGEFQPQNMLPVQFPGSVARYGGYMQDGGYYTDQDYFQTGGMYNEGEELDLSPEEIADLRTHLRAQGYDVEFLD